MVSRLPIENCQVKRRAVEPQRRIQLRFDYLCDRRWESLKTTPDQAVRFCEACRQNVHYCDTIMEARRHAHNGHCIAVDLGVIRRDDDLGRERRWFGRVSPDMMRRQEERMQPDAVSAEREQRKRQQLQDTADAAPAPARPTGTPGERVLVRDGTFAGMEGRVNALEPERGSVRVELTISGRPVYVELELWQVERMA